MFGFWQIGVHHPEEQGPSHLFLARYHMRRSQFGDAEAHAHKATEFREVSALRGEWWLGEKFILCIVHCHGLWSCKD